MQHTALVYRTDTGAIALEQVIRKQANLIHQPKEVPSMLPRYAQLEIKPVPKYASKILPLCKIELGIIGISCNTIAETLVWNLDPRSRSIPGFQIALALTTRCNRKPNGKGKRAFYWAEVRQLLKGGGLQGMDLQRVDDLKAKWKVWEEDALRGIGKLMREKIKMGGYRQ